MPISKAEAETSGTAAQSLDCELEEGVIIIDQVNFYITKLGTTPGNKFTHVAVHLYEAGKEFLSIADDYVSYGHPIVMKGPWKGEFSKVTAYIQYPADAMTIRTKVLWRRS